jgi:hypothetical protein
MFTAQPKWCGWTAYVTTRVWRWAVGHAGEVERAQHGAELGVPLKHAPSPANGHTRPYRRQWVRAPGRRAATGTRTRSRTT